MTEIKRLEVKTKEQNFLSEIQYEFELSPGVSKGILEAAKDHFNPVLFDENGPVGMRMPKIVLSADEPAGKPLTECKLVTVMLTFEMDTDLEVLHAKGVSALRRVKLLRYAEEAYEQDGLLSVEDLALLLNVSERTVRRDTKFLGDKEITIPTRGYMKDIGSAVSHKTKAVELYLKGYPVSEIARRMRHSIRSIERYTQSFGRVVYLKEKGFEKVEIRYAVGISDKLANEYLDLYERYEAEKSHVMDELKSSVINNFKKRTVIL